MYTTTTTSTTTTTTNDNDNNENNSSNSYTHINDNTTSVLMQYERHQGRPARRTGMVVTPNTNVVRLC